MVFIKSKLNSRFELYNLTKVRTYAQHVGNELNVQDYGVSTFSCQQNPNASY